jgi:hypothetical protein
MGSRTFALKGTAWVDMRFKDSLRATKVRAFSPAYFRLMELLPELREVFALGDKVTVAGRTVAIEVTESGVESLSESDLRELQRGW